MKEWSGAIGGGAECQWVSNPFDVKWIDLSLCIHWTSVFLTTHVSMNSECGCECRRVTDCDGITLKQKCYPGHEFKYAFTFTHSAVHNTTKRIATPAGNKVKALKNKWKRAQKLFNSYKVFLLFTEREAESVECSKGQVNKRRRHKENELAVIIAPRWAFGLAPPSPCK